MIFCAYGYGLANVFVPFGHQKAGETHIVFHRF